MSASIPDIDGGARVAATARPAARAPRPRPRPAPSAALFYCFALAASPRDEFTIASVLAPIII